MYNGGVDLLKRLLATFLTFVFIFLLVGCMKNTSNIEKNYNDDRIIGDWRLIDKNNDVHVLHFFAGGIGYSEITKNGKDSNYKHSFEWYVVDDKLVIGSEILSVGEDSLKSITNESDYSYYKIN